MCDKVRLCFLDPSNIKDINGTLISLIPKVPSSMNMKQFWPISLCNVIYKVVAEIIASRSKKAM